MASFFKTSLENALSVSKSFAKHHGTIMAEISHDGSEAQKEFLTAVNTHNVEAILYRFEYPLTQTERGVRRVTLVVSDFRENAPEALANTFGDQIYVGYPT